MARKIIKNITSDKEREFYASKDVDFSNITIAGPADGESAFKESSNIEVRDSHFELRYPFWHNNNTSIINCQFAETCRAGFWYDDGLHFENVTLKGVKAIRECQNITIKNSTFISEEFGWRSSNFDVENSKIDGFYAFFECKDIKIDNIKLKGKYSFQYVENMSIMRSFLDTKDAFWHTKNVTVEDSLIIGEYLGWYSERLTLIRCHIKGTQPLCYCKNLKIIDCTFENCDLSFEYSEVRGTILGKIDSIKNPLRGHIFVENMPTMIVDENDRSNGEFSITVK